MKYPRLVCMTLLLIAMSILACQSSSVSEETEISPLSLDIIQEWQPLPKPKYIGFVSDMPGTYSSVNYHYICTVVGEYYIWVPGDFGDDVSNTIVRTGRVLINGHEYEDLTYEVDRSAHMPRLSEDRTQTLGSHNARTTVCFDSSAFEPGNYIASVQFTGTSGVGYSYSWMFKIPEQ